jgi:hypothetical protein
MKDLKSLTILIVLTIFYNNSCAQNKKPILSKKVKTEKKKLINKRVSDSVSIIFPPPPPAGTSPLAPVKKEYDIRRYKENFRIQKTIYISTDQTASNCAGAFFRHAGLYVKYSKKDKEWTLLCEGIVGFNYEKGYGYEIVVNIYDINYGSGGCADDCPTVKYELVKIVSKKIPK